MRNVSIEKMEKETKVEMKNVVGENLESALENDSVKLSSQANGSPYWSIWGTHFIC